MSDQGPARAVPEGQVAIVGDGASSLTPEVGRRHGVHVLPTYITFGDRTYRDGVDLDAKQFYTLLRNSTRLPTTAQPSVADFLGMYGDLWKQMSAGPSAAIVSIHPSVKMTATVDSARAARRELPNVPIYVIDTGSISMGVGVVAIAAARAAASGQDAESVVRLAEDLARRVKVVFTVETMEYMRRGGRIGGAAALLGTLLNIKPVLQVADGQVQPLEKPRTRRKAVASMLDWMAEQVGSSQSVHAAVLHCDVPDDAQALAQEVLKRFHGVELVMIAEAGPTIGTHGGPGTVGIVFYCD